MAYDYSKLLGRIVEVCGTQAVFASKIGWSERTASLKLNGHRDWKQTEIKLACRILHIAEKEIPGYFFAVKVQN